MVATVPTARAVMVEKAHNAVAALVNDSALAPSDWVYVLELVKHEVLSGVFRQLYPEWFPSPHDHGDEHRRGR